MKLQELQESFKLDVLLNKIDEILKEKEQRLKKSKKTWY